MSTKTKPATPERAKAEPAALARQVEAMKQAQARAAEAAAQPKEPEPETETILKDTRPCGGCNRPFESTALLLEGREICRKTHCDTCIELRDTEEAEERRQQKAAAREADFAKRWSRICPPRYAEPFSIERAIASIRAEREEAWGKTARQKKAEPQKWSPADEDAIREAIAKVQGWPYSDMGLGLVGVSGHCKTRLMFTLVNRYLREGLACEYINLAVFGREIGARFGESPKAAHEWINRLCRVPVLFFDDVGKEKMTERVETEFYGIVEVRSANLLPIYFTANSRGDKLIEKMTDDEGGISDRAMPIVRRLRQFCEGITL